MKLFSRVSNRQLDEFANTLANGLAQRYPPTLETDAKKKLSEKRITKVLEETLLKASKFEEQHNLGVYKKARLANTFKWELKEKGYSDKFIEIATEGLVVYLTRK